MATWVTLVPLQDRPETFRLMADWLRHDEVQKFYREPGDAEQLQAKFGPRCHPGLLVRPYFITCAASSRPVGYAQCYPLPDAEILRFGLDPGQHWGGCDLFIGERVLWGRGIGQQAGVLAVGETRGTGGDARAYRLSSGQ